LDHDGTYPSTLADVGPYFGIAVPIDPFSKTSYIYKRTAGGFTLTCLGKDLAPGGTEFPDRDIIFDERGRVAP
jgi:hypothetical protein